MNIFVVATLWIAWCAMHSILINAFVVGFVKARIPGLVRYYRLLYNGLSLATFLPLADFTRRQSGEMMFVWQGWGVPVRILFLAGAILLFWLGSKRYNLRSFLGIKQLRDGKTHVLLGTAQDFSPTGVFNLTRHPWYLGSLLMLWTILGEYPRPIFVAVAILSLYLVVGTLLEERKILWEYGDTYRRYQEQVSMLFPWKWLKDRLKL
jgi:methanethiol S-methyltransferase